MRYPADPPTIEEIVSVMRHAGDSVHGHRLRRLIVVLWRTGLRICEALALAEPDLDPRRGSLLVRRGHRNHRHRPRPPRADDPRKTARSRTDAATGGGEVGDFLAATIVEVAGHERTGRRAT